MSLLAFIFYLIVAAVCAWIAAAIVPGRVPGGFLTAAIFGIIGAWLGGNLMGSMGPVVEGVELNIEDVLEFPNREVDGCALLNNPPAAGYLNILSDGY